MIEVLIFLSLSLFVNISLLIYYQSLEHLEKCVTLEENILTIAHPAVHSAHLLAKGNRRKKKKNSIRSIRLAFSLLFLSTRGCMCPMPTTCHRGYYAFVCVCLYVPFSFSSLHILFAHNFPVQLCSSRNKVTQTHRKRRKDINEKSNVKSLCEV